jgi:ABC-type Na+ transport system ATPase subunit NatA
MKPLGIRFFRYACFDECFVPLDGGTTVLVGKNNSGKTALLRGLTVLRLLPGGTADLYDERLANYCRQGSGAFDFNLEFLLENADLPQVGPSFDRWSVVQKASRRAVTFEFRYLAIEHMVGVLSVIVTLDATRVKLFERRQQQLLVQQFNNDGTPGGIAILATRSTRAAGGETWPVPEAQGVFSALPQLARVRMVDAHRVVAPQLNMRAVEALAPNVQELTSFLDTLQGNDREKFAEIEEFVKRVFPEIEYINFPKIENSVSLAFKRSGTQKPIPLANWGTGVEQVLSIAAFVLTAPKASTLLLDEPHSYLHPSAERELSTFLQQHPEHRYFISTHSAILINSVPSDKVVVLNSSKVGRPTGTECADAAATLRGLGYKNSDFLFSDRLVFVEGESDQEILPALLGKKGGFPTSAVAKTGFPAMGGEGKLRGTSKQTSLLFFERFLDELGNSSLPRMYLFDGDCNDADRQLLDRTPAIAGKQSVCVKFLPVAEIENYLLVPSAIASAIRKIGLLNGADIDVTEEAVERLMQESLARQDDQKAFPNGVGPDPFRSVKGAIILARIFDSFGIRYTKPKEGRLIAEDVTTENQPRLDQLFDLVRSLFGPV